MIKNPPSKRVQRGLVWYERLGVSFAIAATFFIALEWFDDVQEDREELEYIIEQIQAMQDEDTKKKAASH